MENEFERRLKQEKRMRGENIREFAERIEMSRSQLENLMQGKSSPRLATVYHLSLIHILYVMREF